MWNFSTTDPRNPTAGTKYITDSEKLQDNIPHSIYKYQSTYMQALPPLRDMPNYYYMHSLLSGSELIRPIRYTLLLEIPILFIRAVCQIRSTSFEPKHETQPLPMQHFVRTYAYTRYLKTTARIRTFWISNDCSTIGMSFFCIRLDAR